MSEVKNYHFKAVWQVEIKLDGGTLPAPANGVPDLDVNFGSCKGEQHSSGLGNIQHPRSFHENALLLQGKQQLEEGSVLDVSTTSHQTFQ